MYRTKMEFKTFWIVVLLIYTKVSGGEFYDPTINGASSGNLGDEGNLHSLTDPAEGSGEGTNGVERGHVKGFARPEVNFIAKLRQHQRQRALVPAVAMALERNRPAEIAGADDDYPDIDLATFGEDLGTVVRFLDKHWVELFGEPAGEQQQQQLTAPGQKRAAALRTSMTRRSNNFNMPKERFSPSISVGEFYGALTNLGDFFQNLKQNLETLETRNLSNEQFKLLEGQNMISNLRKEFIEDYPKPAGSAAFLHAIRNYRPSNRIRALVSSVPDLYRGTNFHDPVYKHVGLGK